MTAPACEAFRSAFEPGVRGPHFEACSACRTWSAEVESWRAFGACPSLPGALRARLARIPSGRSAPPLSPAVAGAGQALPAPLRARLIRIPAEARARRRVMKARHVVAASYLLAGLLSLGAALPHTAPSARAASRGFAEAGVRGTRWLLRVGGWIFEECELANQSAEELFDRLGPSARGGETPPPPDPEKETPHGTGKTP